MEPIINQRRKGKNLFINIKTQEGTQIRTSNAYITDVQSKGYDCMMFIVYHRSAYSCYLCEVIRLSGVWKYCLKKI